MNSERRGVWDGRIPVIVTLRTGSDAKPPKLRRPYFAFWWRLWYPSQLYTSIMAHYSRQLGIQCQFPCAWLTDDRDSYLPWHYPVGLLYDLYSARRRKKIEDPQLLPWRLTLHLDRTYPTTTSTSTNNNIPAWGSLVLSESAAFQSAYFSLLKQADALGWGGGGCSAKTVMGLGRAQQLDLYEGFRTHSFEQFWKVNGDLIERKACVAVRAYLVGDDGDGWKCVQAKVSADQSLGDCCKSLSDNFSAAIIHGVWISSSLELWSVKMSEISTRGLGYADNFIHLVILIDNKIA